MSELKLEEWFVYFAPFAVFVGLGYAFYRLMTANNHLGWWRSATRTRTDYPK